MSIWKAFLKKLGAIGEALIWLLYFICADYAVYLIFEFLKIDRSIYKGTFNFCSCVLIFTVMFVISKLLSIKNEPLVKTSKLKPGQVGAILIIAMGMLGFVTLYIIVADKIATYIKSLQQVMDDYRDSVDRFSDAPQVIVPVWDTVLYVFNLCFIVPLAEEMTFRAVIYGRLRRAFKPWSAVIISALIFGSLHGISVHIGYAIVCGILIAACYYLTDSIVAPVILHMIFNLLGSGVATFMSVEEFGFPQGIASNIMLNVNTISLMMMPMAVLAYTYLVIVKRKKDKEAKSLEEASIVQVELVGEADDVSEENTDVQSNMSDLEAKK